jgi:hypothetical protein
MLQLTGSASATATPANLCAGESRGSSVRKRGAFPHKTGQNVMGEAGPCGFCVLRNGRGMLVVSKLQESASLVVVVDSQQATMSTQARVVTKLNQSR